MDSRDKSIAAQACVKASCELFAGSQAPGNALEAAMMFWEWVCSVSESGGDGATSGGGPASAPQGGGNMGGNVAVNVAPSSQTFPPACPDCGGAMWDNRFSKRNPKGPDAKCKNKACGKAIWLPV